MSGWTWRATRDLVVLLAILGLACTTIGIGVGFHMPKALTIDAKILKAAGRGAFWQRCGTGCFQVIEGSGQPAQVISEKGTTALLIFPQLRDLDERVITDLAGRSAWKWLTSAGGPFYIDAHGSAGNSQSVATFGDVQLTVFYNTTLGRTEVQFS